MRRIEGRFALLIIIVFCLAAIGLNRGFSDVDKGFSKSLKQDSVDVWDAFLRTLNHCGLTDPHWEIEPKTQEKLVIYFKAKIDAGVSGGLTSLPPDLSNYLHRFPEEMLQEIRSHAKYVLEAEPNNGAAAKFLAIKIFGEVNAHKPVEKYPLLEKAMVLAPNDIEICFFAYATCTRIGNQMNEGALVSLRQYQRSKRYMRNIIIKYQLDLV